MASTLAVERHQEGHEEIHLSELKSVTCENGRDTYLSRFKMSLEHQKSPRSSCGDMIHIRDGFVLHENEVNMLQ